jgi:hypothetical protein
MHIPGGFTQKICPCIALSYSRRMLTGICKRFAIQASSSFSPIALPGPTSAFVRLQRDTMARLAGPDSLLFVIPANSK